MIVDTMARAIIGKWGNSGAIRISKKELDRLGLREGDPVDYELRPAKASWDVAMLPVFRGGKPATFAQARDNAWSALAEDRLARR